MFKRLDNPGNGPFPDNIEARCALLFFPPLSFPASFLPVINKMIRYKCKISSRKRVQRSFFSSNFFFFFAISIARNVISEIGRCEIISICFVRVLSSCYIIFEFLNSIGISLFESFKKKKKERKDTFVSR